MKLPESLRREIIVIKPSVDITGRSGKGCNWRTGDCITILAGHYCLLDNFRMGIKKPLKSR
jgi:hypothetical protein